MHINRTKVEVRYQETDQMGVVYHANYLVWFEIGRTKFIEDLGVTYAEMEASGVLLPVIDANLSYHQPARYGQAIVIETRLSEYKGIRITYHYKIYTQDGQLLVTGSTKHAFVEKESFQPIRLRSVNPQWHQILRAAQEEHLNGLRN